MTSKKDTLRAALARLFGRARSHAGAVNVAMPQARQGTIGSTRPAVQDGGSLFYAEVRTLPTATLPVLLDGLQGVKRAGANVWPLVLPAAQTIRVECEPMRLAAAAGETPFAPVARSRVQTLPFAMKMGRVRVPLLPLQAAARDKTAWLSEHVPVVRKRRVLSAASAEEQKQRLAAAAGVNADDIQLAGAYPSVPLTRVRHMALADGARSLRLWLRPPARDAVRLWTVTLGRVRSTGRAVQCVTEDVLP